MQGMSRSHGNPQPPRDGPGPKKLWLMLCGWILFGLGTVGIALPVMPTTIFWIGAVWCWSRSAPHLTRRILSHPRFGQPVQLFLDQGMMTRSGKWLALAGMTIGFLLLHLISRPDGSVSLLVALTLLAVGTWLWFRPEPAPALLPDDEALTLSAPPPASASADRRGGGD